MSLYATLTAAIFAYTGLSPTAFFVTAALMVVVYHLVGAMFVYPEEDLPKPSVPPQQQPSFSPPPEPVHVGDVTLEELRAYDGSDPSKPLLVAIKGQVYDVSASRMFYGPGGHYALFAGRDATRALALLSFDPNDLTSNIEGLTSDQLEVLQDWEYKFLEKYVKVGQVVSEKSTKNATVEENENHQQGYAEDVSKD